MVVLGCASWFCEPGVRWASGALAELSKQGSASRPSRLNPRPRRRLDTVTAPAGRLTRTRRVEEDVHLQEPLGAGCSGKVFRGTYRHTGRSCAVKSLKKLPSEVETLCQEAEIHLSLDHPHVVRLERVYESDCNVHLVMEHLEGGELWQRIAARGRFEEREAADAAMHILHGVAYIHARGVEHRDLKPENLLYGSGRLKLIDFGLASSVPRRPSQECCSPCGTLEYVPPEVLDGRHGDRRDLWAVGVVTFMLLTGRSPWYVSSEKTLLAIKAGRPNYEAKHFDQLTDDGKDFVRALLSYDCKLRPSARDALQHRWLASRSDAPLGPCLRSLRGFASLSGMQRWSRVLAIWFHDVEGNLQLQFQRLCNDRCGIQKATFVEALEAEGWIDDAQKLFDAVNLSGSGEISYSEFLAATWRETMLDETSLKLVFQRFDADGDGLITEADLHEALGAKIEAGKLLNDIDARDAGGAHVRNFVSSLRCVPTKPLPTLLGDNPIVVLKRQESSDPSLCERVADLDAHPDASQVMDGIIA